MSQKIGFVGVGRMGANMARRLKEVGHTVSAVYDVRPKAAKDLAAELGCEHAKKLARVTELSDVVFTVVTDDAAMNAIYPAAGDGLLKGASGRTFINCATISPHVHVEVERRAEAVGARSLEACMASSITQARQGTLYLMIGGKQEVFERARELLVKLSKEGELLKYIGSAGKAAQVKALVNMVMNVNTAALAEGLGLAKALDLDVKTVMDVFSQTGANSRVLATDGEDMVNRDHACFFSAAHAAKDSGIALGLAKRAKLNLPLAKATFAQYSKMTRLGLGELDKSGIAELTFPGRTLHRPKPARGKAGAKKSASAKSTKKRSSRPMKQGKRR